MGLGWTHAELAAFINQKSYAKLPVGWGCFPQAGAACRVRSSRIGAGAHRPAAGSRLRQNHPNMERHSAIRAAVVRLPGRGEIRPGDMCWDVGSFSDTTHCDGQVGATPGACLCVEPFTRTARARGAAQRNARLTSKMLRLRAGQTRMGKAGCSA